MKKLQKIIPFLLSVCLLCSMSVTAFAAGELPDLTKEGSITVTVRDTERKQPVSGGSLTLYQVASVNVDDGNFSFVYTDAFSHCGLALDDIQSEDLAAGLAEYAAGQSLRGTTVSVNANGKASISKLELGLYLVTQDSPAAGYAALNPFLVSIPLKDGDSLVYNVDASPKAGTVVTADEPDPTPSGDTSAPASGTPASAPSKLAARTLPQTGQLWWPVPFLAIAGMLFVALGWLRRKHAER